MRADPAPDDADAQLYDCWNRIGVRGDKSCPELERHSHCRNCPAYSTAAATLLDRDGADYREYGVASVFAGLASREAGKTESAVIFRVGAEWFALSTGLVSEIVGLRAVHSLPHRRNPLLLGVTNVRGELVICISIARLLVGGDAVLPERGRLIVVRHASGRLAFPVDEVQHIHRYHPDELKPVPATVARSASTFTSALLPWEDRTVASLDGHLVLETLIRGLA